MRIDQAEDLVNTTHRADSLSGHLRIKVADEIEIIAAYPQMLLADLDNPDLHVLKQFVNSQDGPIKIEYRCPTCCNCQKLKMR